MKLSSMTPIAAAFALSLSVAHAEGTPAPAQPAPDAKAPAEGKCGGMKKKEGKMSEGMCGGMKMEQKAEAAKGDDKAKADEKPKTDDKAAAKGLKAVVEGDKPRAAKEGKCGEGKCGASHARKAKPPVKAE